MHHQIRPILFVLAPPHKLRVEVAIAAFIGQPNRRLLVLAHHRFEFRGRDVFALGVIVLYYFNSFFGLSGFFCHVFIP